MKEVIVDLKGMALTAVAGAFTMIGSVFALPGRLLSWIGNGFTSLGGRIAVYVSDKHDDDYQED